MTHPFATPDAQPTRRRQAAGVVVALLAGLLNVIAVAVAPPAAAAPALLCDQNTIYGINSTAVSGYPAGSLFSINVNTGATALVAAMAPTNNALGVSESGLDAYAWQNSSTSSTLAHYDTASGAVTSISGVDTSAPSSIIRGAINPATGIYYYGGGGSAAYIGGYDTGRISGSAHPIGQIGTISIGGAVGNGDFAFSSRGLLFLASANQVLRVDNPTVPTTAGSATLTTTLVATLDNTVNSPGITFASNGFLYVTSGSTLYKLDPANGDLLATHTIANSLVPTDLGSCTYPNTVSVQANVGARVSATDQFALSVVGGTIESGNTATTSGTATGLQPQVAGAALTTPGYTYTATATAAGTTDLSRYVTSYSCVDVNLSTSVTSGSGASTAFVFPAPSTPAGVDVMCTFTITAKPSLTVTAAVSGSRANAGDQFTVAVHTGSAAGPIVNATTNSTTTGSGGTVTSGSGTTGTYVGAAGTTYYITETAAGSTNLAQYGRLISCTDSNSLEPGLPTNQPFTGSLAITVVAGAQISCVVTNAPTPPTITLVAALGSTRASAGDQFTTAIHTGSASGPVVNSTATSTSTGSGSTITPGTGTTGAYTATAGTSYYPTDTASGPGSALYTTTISCVDANGVQSGLPSGALTAGTTITPITGAAITCTLTDTATPAGLSLTKTNPVQLVPGQVATYTLTVTNHGGTAVTSAQILDRLPSNIAYSSAVGTGWSCVASGSVTLGQLVTCDYVGSIGALATSNLSLNVVPQAPAAGTFVRNRASVNTTAGGSPVDPNTCSADDVPAGCAVPPIQALALVDAQDDYDTTAPATAVTTSILANDTVEPEGTTSINPASVLVTGAPAHGSTSVNPGTGAITYTPDAGFSGLDSFTYRVCDTSSPTPICDPATVFITVPNVVTAVDDGATTPQNTPVTTAVISNDTVSTSGAPLDPSTVTITADPSHGTATVNPATGEITYTPATAFAGTDILAYQVCDTSSPTPVCDTALLVITVASNVVLAQDDGDTTAPGTPVATNVRANDSTSTPAAPLANPTVTLVPQHGTSTVDPTTGDIVYTPAVGFSGVDSYQYQVCDMSEPEPVCDTATVTITVPNLVTAVDDSASTPQNTPVTTNVLVNDTVLPDAAPLDPTSVTVTAGPAHGSTSVNPSTGAITYTPTAGYTGPDGYSYQVCDTSTPEPVCAVATVSITVGGNTVSAGADSATTPPGTAVSIDVRGNDSTATGQPLANPTVTVPPAHGTATIDPETGSIVYTPAVGFSGVDTFTYQVCDTSTPTAVCDAATVTITVPSEVTPVNDETTTPQNTPVTIDVLGNDTVTENGAPLDPASVQVTSGPEHGTITVDPETGAVTYTPAPDYSGPDTFTYEVCDTSTPEPVCATATVTLTVGTNTVVATDDNASTPPATPVAIDVLSNDTQSPTGSPLNPASVTVTVAAAHGSTSVDPATDTITYTPDAGFAGTDSFDYQVCDASTPTPVCDTATVTVAVPNGVEAVDDNAITEQNTPVAVDVLGNDIISAGGAPLDPATVTVTVAAAHGSTSVDPETGVITYTPATGYSGTDSLTYRVCDTSTPTPVCDLATVLITIPANVVAAVDDTDTTAPATPVTTVVLSNDTSATGQPLGIPEIVSGPAHGTATPNGDGSVTYTPDAGFSGVDSYGYLVCDTSDPVPACDDAVVTITVPNSLVVNPDEGTTPQNTPISTPVLDNDTVLPSAAPLDPASVSVTTAPTNGTTSVDPATGAITYTPATGFSGVDTYNYEVCDTSSPEALCGTAMVTITVGSNTVVANPDSETTPPVTPVDIDVIGNDSSSTGQPLDPTSVEVTPAAHGSVVVNPETGVVTYTPASGFGGVDIFSYTVCDTSFATAACDSALVTVTVPSPFELADDAAETPQNTPVVIDVLVNDTTTSGGTTLDPASESTLAGARGATGVGPGSAITVAATHGVTSVNPLTGQITYTPDADYSGPDTFTYTVCDTSVPETVCAVATVTVLVGPNVVTATDDIGTTLPATSIDLDVLGNDTALDGGALLDPSTVEIVVAPGHGSTTIDPATGVISYLPTDGFTGVDTFDYQVCDLSTPEVVCDTATVTITVPVVGLSLVKTATVLDTNGDGVTSVGDTIVYTFTVTNIGEVIATNVAVADAMIGEVSCPSSELAAGASMVCAAVNGHVITAADAVTGVSNSATAVSDIVCPAGSNASCPAIEVSSEVTTVVTPVSTDAQLTVVKSGNYVDADHDGRTSVGDVVTWTITVTNPGTAPLTALVVSDPTAGLVTCPVTTLEAGATVICTVADHLVTQDDIAAGFVRNIASASGVGPAGDIVSPAATVEVALPANATLSYTGAAVGTVLGLAGLALLIGFGLLLGGRRRRVAPLG